MLEARGNKEKEVTLRQGQQKEVFKVIERSVQGHPLLYSVQGQPRLPTSWSERKRDTGPGGTGQDISSTHRPHRMWYPGASTMTQLEKMIPADPSDLSLVLGSQTGRRAPTVPLSSDIHACSVACSRIYLHQQFKSWYHWIVAPLFIVHPLNKKKEANRKWRHKWETFLL